MTYDGMNKKDEALAKLAETIITAYNNSGSLMSLNYKVKHTKEGFSLISVSDGNGPSSVESVRVTNLGLHDFVVNAIFLLTGHFIRWDILCRYEPVIDALQKEYGTKNLNIEYVPEYHSKFGDCLVCSTVKGWSNGYYRFNNAGELEKVPT